MNQERSWLTTKECAKLLKCTLRNITYMIERGELSATRENNRYYIDKSEFFRLHPEAMAQQEKAGNEKKLEENDTRKFLEEKNSHLQDMIKEKTKQIDFLKEQLNQFAQEKSKMLDAINCHARLLEHKQEKENIVVDGSIPKSRWSKLFSKKD